MMKRLFVIFLMLFCSTGSFAGYDAEKEIFVYPDVLEYIVNDWVYSSTDIAEEQMDTFIDVFRNSLSDAGTFTASNLRNAAAAAKIEGDDLTQLLDVLLTVFHDSCKLNSDYDKCMKGFEPFAVRLPEGVALAKDYIKHNYKIDVVCSAEPRKEGGLHYLRCSSLNNKYWFELPFAALNEVKDDVILHGVLGAVGKIHNADLLTGISAVSAIAKDGDDGFAAYNVSDAAKCSQINETLNKLGYQSKVVKNSKVKQNYVNHINTIYGTNDFVLNTYTKSGIVHPDNVSNDLCEVSGIVLSENDLKTAFNIDNMAFLGVTAQMGDMTVDKYVENYVRNHMTKNGYTLSSFSCAESTSHAFVKGERDEILKCYVNGQEVDFVFNDLSEWKRRFRKSGKQRMDCAIIGGVYSGEDCLGPDEDLCLKLRAANIKSCPECSLVEWDPKNEICVMPESAYANLQEKSVNIALIAGGTAFNMIVSWAMGEHPGVIFFEAAGGVIEMIAQYKIDYIADGFLLESNSCKDAQCAEKLLKENLTSLARVESTINKTDARAIDKEMARLVELIPANSDFYKKVVNKGLSDFDDGGYNAAEIWRAVGIAMQFAGMAKSVGTALMRKSDYWVGTLSDTMGVLKRKVDDATILIKQESLSELLTKADNANLKMFEIMDMHGIDALPMNSDELAQLYAKHPDLKQASDARDDLLEQVRTFRSKNPELWKPGEDVADYYDVEALQTRMKRIADEDADYIAELKVRAEKSDKGITKQTDEVKQQIKELEKQKEDMVEEILASKGLGSDKIDRFGMEEQHALEQLLRDKDPELNDLYKKMKSARDDGNHKLGFELFEQYHNKLEQYPEYKDLSVKIASEQRVLEKQQREAKRLIDTEEEDILKIDAKIKELENTYTPEYEDYLNEVYYAQELYDDALKTRGDKLNVEWWNAIPQEIKDKYVQAVDDNMMDILAGNEEIVKSINNWDAVKNDPDAYKNFMEKVVQEVNKQMPNGQEIRIDIYNDPNVSTAGLNNSYLKQMEMNAHYYMGADVEEPVGLVKHELLGHQFDVSNPNMGLQGETMQDFVRSENYSRYAGTEKIHSHGNADDRITNAVSPLTRTHYSVGDISDEAADALRDEGWAVYRQSDNDTYSRYRAEITEQAAHSVTPTTNVKSKVNARTEF